MRLYGSRYLKRHSDRRVQLRMESRDAVLWSVDTTTNTARVKIQGSAEEIVAHFPRNWSSRPYWLKEGNAVRVIHKGGIRGYIEIVGEGRAIPTPVDGSSALPIPAALPDGIVTGLEVTATSPETMSVNINSGTYRIDGTIYYLDPEDAGFTAIVMNDPAPMTMGSAEVMLGRAQGTVSIDPAPAEGLFRYDLICVGTDYVIDYIAGTASANPSPPSLPSNHVVLAYIFVVGGATEIYRADIGGEFVTRVPTYLEVTVATGEEFEWDTGNNYPYTNVTVVVKCQYGWTLSTTYRGYSITLTKDQGSGQVWSSDEGYDDDEVTQAATHTATFRYRRDQTVTEEHCVFTVVLYGRAGVTNGFYIILLDSAGDPVV